MTFITRLLPWQWAIRCFNRVFAFGDILAYFMYINLWLCCMTSIKMPVVDIQILKGVGVHSRAGNIYYCLTKRNAIVGGVIREIIIY